MIFIDSTPIVWYNNLNDILEFIVRVHKKLPLFKLEMTEGNTIRLYALDEIKSIFNELGMGVCDSYADFSGTLSSDNGIQLMVFLKMRRKSRLLCA